MTVAVFGTFWIFFFTAYTIEVLLLLLVKKEPALLRRRRFWALGMILFSPILVVCASFFFVQV